MLKVNEIRQKSQQICDNIERVIVGKREVIEYVLSVFLAGGHVLLEDVPGDAMSRILWKASARTGTWQVRTSAYKASEPALILLNLESPGTFTNYGAMEENIKIVYSLVYFLDQRALWIIGTDIIQSYLFMGIWAYCTYLYLLQ